ncbi:predicted protein [Lichtheimia corymbifera JMRC:FSU:9682]|uniref:Uncharacterized protein n=1 Tax=Lichtheimia corymbifera JMRC:FSU:9682 TaxID=1263082 RepID=A0A068S5T4_9FUNG|nr:predicted protein [Lichtheimia corymbifera JMRC:FSU:9682]
MGCHINSQTHHITNYLHLDKPRWKKLTTKGLTSNDHMATFNQHGGFDGWIQSSAAMRYPEMLLWLLGASSAGTIIEYS